MWKCSAASKLLLLRILFPTVVSHRFAIWMRSQIALAEWVLTPPLVVENEGGFWVSPELFVPHGRRMSNNSSVRRGDVGRLRLRKRRDLNQFIVIVVAVQACVDQAAVAACLETCLELTQGGCYHALRLVSRFLAQHAMSR